MNPRQQSTPPAVRLLFEISRDDNPRLYDDLMRFNKGPKRVNRLRFLAYEGLLLQMGLALSANKAQEEQVDGASRVDSDAAAHTVGAFELPEDE